MLTCCLCCTDRLGSSKKLFSHIGQGGFCCFSYLHQLAILVSIEGLQTLRQILLVGSLFDHPIEDFENLMNLLLLSTHEWAKVIQELLELGVPFLEVINFLLELTGLFGDRSASRCRGRADLEEGGIPRLLAYHLAISQQHAVLGQCEAMSEAFVLSFRPLRVTELGSQVVDRCGAVTTD